MAKLYLALVLLAGISCQGIVYGVEWETVPDDIVFACAGSRVTLPWRYKTTETEKVVNVHWIHDGAFSTTMVATVVHGNFVALDDYHARAQHVTNGGLVIRDLRVDDSGNYTLEINVDKQGMFHSYRHSVYLQVGDGLMIEGGQLRAEQEPEATWDESHQEWRIRLACGPFTFISPPPLDVDWASPDGQTQPSTGYDEDSNRFYLTLPTPVRGGNYTCTIPPVRHPDVCLRQHGSGNQASTTASVSVDETKARLSVLEANQNTLREENENMKARMLSLETEMLRETENETKYCEEMKKMLEVQIDDLKTAQQTLQDKLQDIQQAVIVTGPCVKGKHKTIDDPRRSTSVLRKINQKPICDKDLQPGWYRFFLNGTNAVVPTSCPPTLSCKTNAPLWLDLQGKSLPSPGQETAARACANWSGHCCFWETPITVRNCGNYFVYKLKPQSDCHLAFCAEPSK